MTDLLTRAESHLATGPLWQRSRDVAKAIGCSDLQLRRAIAKERKKGREPFATCKWISLMLARKDRMADRVITLEMQLESLEYPPTTPA